MSAKENILITEREEITVPPLNIQKIVSISYRPGVEHFYRDSDFDGYEDIYYGLDEAVDRLVSESKKEKLFFYRDISFLQCFRLTLFFYLVSAELLQRTFRRWASAHAGSRFYIEKNDFDRQTPYLSHILTETCPPDLMSRVSILEKRQALDSLRSNLLIKSALKNIFWPAKIQNRGSRNPKVLFYSDYYRASAVMKTLGYTNCFYYTCAPEPKIFLSSLRYRFSFIQNVCSGSDEVAYRTKIEPQRLETALRSLLERSFDSFPQLRGVARGVLEYLFRTELPGIFFQIDQAHELFEEQPSLESVLLDEDLSPFKNVLCQTAMKFKKKCFVESHGALGDKYGFLPLTADYIFVWGEAQKKKLIQWGSPPERIVVSGCSKYKTYKTKNEQTIRVHLSKRYGFPLSDPIVSFFPFPSFGPCLPHNKTIQDRVELILNSLKSEKIQLIIKLHPGETNKNFYYSWTQKNNTKSKIVIIERADPLLIAKASDFLIVHDSTMAMDGFAMEKPVIFFPYLPENVFSSDSVSEFKNYGIFHRPKDAQEFCAIFKTLLSNPDAALTDPNREKMLREGLNEGADLPEEIISSYLLGKIRSEQKAFSQ